MATKLAALLKPASTGPLYPFLWVALGMLLFLESMRLLYLALNWQHTQTFADVGWILLRGAWVDVSSLCRLMLLPLTLYAVSFHLPRTIGRFVEVLCTWWLQLMILAFFFFEAITPTYIVEYGTRPERKFFEYLDAPGETINMLALSFPWQFATIAVGLILVMIFSRSILKRLFGETQGWSLGKTIILLPLTLMAMFAGAHGNFHGKPLHPGQLAFSRDILLNNLPLNSLFSASFAAYRMLEEVDPTDVYGNLSQREVDEIATREKQLPRHYSAVAHAPDKPLNLVIILEESLGARFVKSLGGEDLTPNLEQLKEDGWWFDNMYATGTRSVRGIEATVSGFLPTPGRSIVRLSDSQTKLFSLASILTDVGYEAGFFYGGRADFDNMRGFVLNNDFDYVFDEENIKNGKFRSTYGYCDDDIFDAIDNRLKANSGTPQFIVTLTTSNHQPFEFPVDDDNAYTKPLYTRENTVRYADVALGRFFEKAKAADYWENTVFLVVADHDARANEVWNRYREAKKHNENIVFPILGFKIPALFVGGDIKPKVSRYIASQIDLPTTILGLLDISAPHPMIGHDLTAVGDGYIGRAIMQFADYHAHLFGDRIVILRPGQLPYTGYYRNNEFEASEESSFEPLKREALALAIWPYQEYSKGRYHN